MKLAVIGVDAATLALVRAGLASGERHFVAVYDVDAESPHGQELLALLPVAEWSSNWESLLHGAAADAVLLARGGDPERRADQLRKLTQAAAPQFVVHPGCEAIVGFELAMIREDTHGPLVPFIPDALHPAIGRLAEFVAQGNASPIRAVEQLAIERQMVERGRVPLLAQLAADAELARAVLGTLNKVSALGGGDESLTGLSVHLAGPAGTIARWTAGPVEREPGARLVLFGASGRAVLWLPADFQGEAKLEVQPRDRPAETISFPDWNAATAGWSHLDRHLSGEEPAPTWQQACRASEIAETVEYSLKRGRTIELHHETHSEQETFKGMMAAGSCGLLMLAMVFLLVFAIVEGFRMPYRERVTTTATDGPPAAPVPRTSLVWRMWPVYPLAAFLLLQLLLFVFHKPPSRLTKPREGSE